MDNIITYDLSVSITGEIRIVNNLFVEKLIIPDNIKINKIYIINCPKLKAIQIGSMLYGEGIFDFRVFGEINEFFICGCSMIRQIYVDSINIANKDTLCKDYFMSNMPSLSLLQFTNNPYDKVEYIGRFAFSNTNISSFREMFKANKLLKYIDEYAFSNNRALTNIANMFMECSNLVSVGQYTFSNCIILDDASSVFRDSGIIQIPDKLFKNSTNITRCNLLFYNCKSLQCVIPDDFLIEQIKINKADRIFYGCSLLESVIPNDFLSNHPDITDVTYMFYYTRIYGNIPNGFLSKCNKLISTNGLFCNTNISGSIPDSFLLLSNDTLVDVGYMFSSTKITGNLPNGFLVPSSTSSSKIENMEGIFMNSLIINTNSRFMNNFVSLKNCYRAFKDCLELMTLGGNDYLLYESRNLVRTSEMFMNCKKLKIIATHINNFNLSELTETASMFCDCANLDTLNIPSDFMNNCPKLSYVSTMFCGCYSLSTLPLSQDFLSNCPALQRANGLFSGCRALSFSIPPNFLKNSPYIFHMSGVFSGCVNLTGAIPDDFLQNRSSLLYVHDMLYK